jgi:hypothetical protein
MAKETARKTDARASSTSSFVPATQQQPPLWEQAVWMPQIFDDARRFTEDPLKNRAAARLGHAFGEVDVLSDDAPALQRASFRDAGVEDATVAASPPKAPPPPDLRRERRERIGALEREISSRIDARSAVVEQARAAFTPAGGGAPPEKRLAAIDRELEPLLRDVVRQVEVEIAGLGPAPGTSAAGTTGIGFPVAEHASWVSHLKQHAQSLRELVQRKIERTRERVADLDPGLLSQGKVRVDEEAAGERPKDPYVIAANVHAAFKDGDREAAFAVLRPLPIRDVVDVVEILRTRRRNLLLELWGYQGDKRVVEVIKGALDPAVYQGEGLPEEERRELLPGRARRTRAFLEAFPRPAQKAAAPPGKVDTKTSYHPDADEAQKRVDAFDLVERNRRLARVEPELKPRDGGFHYGGARAVRPTSLVAPTESKRPPRLARVREGIFQELMVGEGSQSSVNSYDRGIFSFGPGLAGAQRGALMPALTRFFEQSPESRDALRELGFAIEDGTFRALDTAEKQMKEGDEALRVVAKSRELQTRFVDLAEAKATRQIWADAAWEVVRAHAADVPDAVLKNDAWTDELIVFVAHLVHSGGKTWGQWAEAFPKPDARRILFEKGQAYASKKAGGPYVVRPDMSYVLMGSGNKGGKGYIARHHLLENEKSEPVSDWARYEGYLFLTDRDSPKEARRYWRVAPP